LAIVHNSDPIVLVGGSQIGPQELNISPTAAKHFVGVDAGADHLMAYGIDPLAVIGDLDSLSDAARAKFAAVLHHIPEQDTVDFEKALRNVEAPLIYAVGFAGGRLDHTLAVLHVMGRYAERPVILLSADDASVVVPRAGLSLTLPIGCRVSVMPLADARVDASGLVWPIIDQEMHPMGFTSPSNAAAQASVGILAMGPVVVTLPRSALPALETAVVHAG